MTAIPKNVQRKFAGLFLIPELQAGMNNRPGSNIHPGSLRRVKDLSLERKILDLNDYLVKNPSDTFLIRVNGNSMINAGIDSGDLLLVDRSISPETGHVVVASVNRHIIVKRLQKSEGAILLKSENSDYEDIRVSYEDKLDIWGVVTSVIKNFA